MTRHSVPDPGPWVLAINGGSSSIKLAAYRQAPEPALVLRGQIERIGVPGTRLSWHDPTTGSEEPLLAQAADHREAAHGLLQGLERRLEVAALRAIGHRIVHGGARYMQPQRVTPELLAEVQRLGPYDPEHLPMELDLLRLLQERFPDVPQIACFDTAFHRTMPRVARLLPIPRKYLAQGVERFGFHGLSYAYLMGELERVAGRDRALGRVILAHLGNGASLAAVLDGKSVDTSMGFTPAAGLPMSTRSGDLDPGLVWYLARTQHLDPEQFHAMVNRQSGLLGISETSPDMQDLLLREATDVRAAEAVELFCYQVKKWIGAYAAALGGLDILVFAGGIGENAPAVRERACAGLGFLGIILDEAANRRNATVVSAAQSRVTVHVLRTDEDIMIARAACQLLAEQRAGVQHSH